jgi:ATP-dependent DNA helicase
LNYQVSGGIKLIVLEMSIKEKKLGNPLMQLRLVCNSPHNFYNPWSFDETVPVGENIVTSSGKMLLLDRLLPTLFERGHKVLIFTQFKTQLDILHDYCVELRGWNVCRIDGSVAQTDRREQIKNFNEDPDFKIFLLSTRAGGQGINLASADTVILFDRYISPTFPFRNQCFEAALTQVNPATGILSRIFKLKIVATVLDRHGLSLCIVWPPRAPWRKICC